MSISKSGKVWQFMNVTWHKYTCKQLVSDLNSWIGVHWQCDTCLLLCAHWRQDDRDDHWLARRTATDPHTCLYCLDLTSERSDKISSWLTGFTWYYSDFMSACVSIAQMFPVGLVVAICSLRTLFNELPFHLKNTECPVHKLGRASKTQWRSYQKRR